MKSRNQIALITSSAIIMGALVTSAALADDQAGIPREESHKIETSDKTAGGGDSASPNEGSPTDGKRSATGPDDEADSSQSAIRDAWVEGKLEAVFLLNRHLNNFTISPEVKGNTATLTGSVESDIDRDLAEQLTINIDEIDRVENKLKVANKEEKASREGDADAERSFASRVEDATVTADVKLHILSNDNIGGLDIDVDTKDGRVTLTGQVNSSVEKDLAGTIAKNVDGVKSIDNKLTVSRTN